ncbi:hypothetical protein [Buchnera aphidicola]|uniref:hypothetical protein n=1 Tax=Buchnera aphidicola TaxID=9 RepID=UPI002237BBD3
MRNLKNDLLKVPSGCDSGFIEILIESFGQVFLYEKVFTGREKKINIIVKS